MSVSIWGLSGCCLASHSPSPPQFHIIHTQWYSGYTVWWKPVNFFLRGRAWRLESLCVLNSSTQFVYERGWAPECVMFWFWVSEGIWHLPSSFFRSPVLCIHKKRKLSLYNSFRLLSQSHTNEKCLEGNEREREREGWQIKTWSAPSRSLSERVSLWWYKEGR